MFERIEETNDKDMQTNTRVVTPECVEGLVPLFEAFLHVNRVILFGSRARKDHQERSDIDLAVDAPNMDILAWDKLYAYITNNSPTLLPLDLIWLQQAPHQLAERIRDEGVIVFERKNESIV